MSLWCLQTQVFGNHRSTCRKYNNSPQLSQAYPVSISWDNCTNQMQGLESCRFAANGAGALLCLLCMPVGFKSYVNVFWSMLHYGCAVNWQWLLCPLTNHIDVDISGCIPKRYNANVCLVLTQLFQNEKLHFQKPKSQWSFCSTTNFIFNSCKLFQVGYPFINHFSKPPARTKTINQFRVYQATSAKSALSCTLPRFRYIQQWMGP